MIPVGLYDASLLLGGYLALTGRVSDFENGVVYAPSLQLGSAPGSYAGSR